MFFTLLINFLREASAENFGKRRFCLFVTIFESEKPHLLSSKPALFPYSNKLIHFLFSIFPLPSSDASLPIEKTDSHLGNIFIFVMDLGETKAILLTKCVLEGHFERRGHSRCHIGHQISCHFCLRGDMLQWSESQFEGTDCQWCMKCTRVS